MMVRVVHRRGEVNCWLHKVKNRIVNSCLKLFSESIAPRRFSISQPVDSISIGNNMYCLFILCLNSYLMMYQ